MLSILIALRDLRFALPAGFMLAVVPPVVSTWGVIRLTTGFCRLLATPFSSSSTFTKFHRLADDCLYSFYSRLTVFFFETYSRVEVIFYGDIDSLLAGAPTENILLLSNHQTTADWMVINILAARVNEWPGPLGHVRYVMKSGLKFLPLIGFYLGTYARGGVFVRRLKDAKKPISQSSSSSIEEEPALSSLENKGTISSSDSSEGESKRTICSLERIRRWRTDDGVPSWLVLYPEGTRFDLEDEGKIKKSTDYAINNGLVPLQHLLFPRSKAVRDSLTVLGSSLDAVYHVTIAYSSTFGDSSTGVERLPAPSMSDILMGKNPRVHVHLRRIAAADLPSDLTVDESSVRDWLYSLYLDADDRLKGFYSFDPGRRGKLKLSSPSDSEKIRFAPLSIFKTLPTFVIFSLVMTAVLSSPKGRRFYWGAWLLGSPALAALGALIY